MELRVIFLAFISGSITGILVGTIIGALFYLGFSEMILKDQDIFTDLLSFLPSAVLGFVAGYLSVGRPLVSSLIAGILSSVLLLALTYAFAGALGESLSSLNSSDLLMAEAPSLLVGIAVAYFTFRVRQHSNKSSKPTR